MTSVLTREDFRARTGEEFRARLMALVLTAVLVWYTLVVPPYAPAQGRAWRPPEDEGADGEVRPARRACGEAGAEAADVDAPAEELDWPEYIGLD
jgi:hypothetical protein